MDNRINVLMIEDNPGDARMIRELLTEVSGISCCLLWAGRLSSGIQQIKEGGVDLVLLDLSLPDSEGFDTYRKLRAQAEALPVILLTGCDDKEMAMRAVREGAKYYIVKNSVTAQLLSLAITLAVAPSKKAMAASGSSASDPEYLW